MQYPPQQQQQRSGAYPQQQQQYPNQYPNQYGGQQYPNQQQPGAYPYQQQSTCCPEDPNTHICDTNPIPEPGLPPSALACLWQRADATTWTVLFFFLMSVLGFALTVGVKGPDNILSHFGVSNSLELDNAITKLVVAAFDEESQNATKNATGALRAAVQCVLDRPDLYEIPRENFETPNDEEAEDSMVTALWAQADQANFTLQCTYPMLQRTECFNSDNLFGTFGVLCAEESLTATAMLMNQSRWLVFRGTLYFLAMMGTFTLFVVIILVDKQKDANKLLAGGAPGSYDPRFPMMIAPVSFYGTKFYYMFRTAWATVSVVIFFWVITEMYQYWWFIKDYKALTTGELNSFWVNFDKKFVPAVICVTIFLCWPLAYVLIQIPLFIVGLLPWCGVRAAYEALANAKIDPERRHDDHSGCIRADLFFMKFNQVHRLGFSEGQWEMMTDSRVPFCTVLDCDAAATGPYGGQPMQQGNMMGQPPMQQRGMAMPPSSPQQGAQPESPKERRGRSKSRKPRSSSSSSEGGGRHRRTQSAGAESLGGASFVAGQQAATGGMARGFTQPSNSTTFSPNATGQLQATGTSFSPSGTWNGPAGDSDLRQSTTGGVDKKDKKSKRDKKEKRDKSVVRQSTASSAWGDDGASESPRRDKSSKKDKKDKASKKDKKDRD